MASRAADMARKGHLRVAGVIENMSPFTCDHGTTYALFGAGGGARLAAEIGVPLVGTVPLHPDMAAAGDAGAPVALGTGPLAAAFDALATAIADDIAPVVETAGCTARLLERVEAALTTAVASRRPTGDRRPGWPPRRRGVVGIVADRARPSSASLRRWAHSDLAATGSSSSLHVGVDAGSSSSTVGPARRGAGRRPPPPPVRAGGSMTASTVAAGSTSSGPWPGAMVARGGSRASSRRRLSR